jgi:hypothetical protein
MYSKSTTTPYILPSDDPENVHWAPKLAGFVCSRQALESAHPFVYVEDDGADAMIAWDKSMEAPLPIDPEIFNRPYNIKVPKSIKEGFRAALEAWAVRIQKDIDALGGCQHTFAQYMGFSETYEFCTKCDEKRRGR